jgi:hypothetical protein
MRHLALWSAAGAWLVVAGGCNTRLASSGSPTAGDASGDLTSCQPGHDLAGAQYDVTKSHFAFGGPPVRDDQNGFVRWVGPDGVVAIETTGAEMGIMNGGAAETNLPDWSNDPAALGAHVRDYFLSFGVAGCQMPETQVQGGSGGSTIGIAHLVDGILVAESLAYARFNNNEQTTSEGFYWPTVPAAVVDAARALHARLADPTMAAAYKALLPAADQGDGEVVIHHTSSSSTAAFASAATYDVSETGLLGFGRTASFDAMGHDVTTSW